MKLLYEDDMPCWYELSWQKTEPAIILRIHKDFIKNIKLISENAPIVIYLKKEFGFKNFIGSFDGNFGFDNAFIRNKETKEFVEFLIKIPKIKHEKGVCKDCKGSGENEFGGMCFFCGGEGIEYINKWEVANAISASFTVFPSSWYFPGIETSSSLIQLLTISTMTSREVAGGSIGGEFSAPLRDWMDSLGRSGKSNIFEMVEAMKLAHKVMFGLKEYEKDSFRAFVGQKNGWLSTTCPGNACGIDPEENGFSSHNVDTPTQQIELIASLAALHDKARKEMNI